MIRLCYIIGPYRHVNERGEPDGTRMACEVANEAYWASVLARAGIMPIRPLANSVSIETCKTGDDWVAGDLEILKRLRPSSDFVLIRSGAFNTLHQSVGSKAEMDLAEELGLTRWYTRMFDEDVEKASRIFQALAEGDEALHIEMHRMYAETIRANG